MTTTDQKPIIYEHRHIRCEIRNGAPTPNVLISTKTLAVVLVAPNLAEYTDLATFDFDDLCRRCVDPEEIHSDHALWTAGQKVLEALGERGIPKPPLGRVISLIANSLATIDRISL